MHVFLCVLLSHPLVSVALRNADYGNLLKHADGHQVPVSRSSRTADPELPVAREKKHLSEDEAKKLMGAFAKVAEVKKKRQAEREEADALEEKLAALEELLFEARKDAAAQMRRTRQAESNGNASLVEERAKFIEANERAFDIYRQVVQLRQENENYDDEKQNGKVNLTLAEEQLVAADAQFASAVEEIAVQQQAVRDAQDDPTRLEEELVKKRNVEEKALQVHLKMADLEGQILAEDQAAELTDAKAVAISQEAAVIAAQSKLDEEQKKLMEMTEKAFAIRLKIAEVEKDDDVPLQETPAEQELAEVRTRYVEAMDVVASLGKVVQDVVNDPAAVEVETDKLMQAHQHVYDTHLAMAELQRRILKGETGRSVRESEDRSKAEVVSLAAVALLAAMF